MDAVELSGRPPASDNNPDELDTRSLQSGPDMCHTSTGGSYDIRLDKSMDMTPVNSEGSPVKSLGLVDPWRSRASGASTNKRMSAMTSDTSMRGFIVPPPSSFSRSSISRTSHAMPQRVLVADTTSFMGMPDTIHSMEPMVSDGERHVGSGAARARMATILLENYSDDEDDIVETPRDRPLPFGSRETMSATRPPRAYYLDWMRIVSIYLLVAYHGLEALQQVGMWCDDRMKQEISYRSVMLQIAMPIFFHISGRAQALATMGRPLKLKREIWRRAVRLLLPFVACYVTLIPMWRWVSETETMETCQLVSINNHTVNITRWKPKDDLPQQLFEYIFCYWTDKRCFKFDPNWLWFLPALFAVTVFCSPLFLFAESQQPLHLAFFCLFLVGQSITVSMVQLPVTFNIFLILSPAVVVYIVWRVPLPEVRGEQSGSQLERFFAVRVVTVAHVIATLGAVSSFRYDQFKVESRLRVFPGLFMYPLFYTQGFFVQRYWPEKMGSKRIDLVTPAETFQTNWSPTNSHGVLARTRGLQNNIRGYEFVTLLFLLFFIFLGGPTGDTEESKFWPVHSASSRGEGWDYHGMMYVLFTWAWIGLSSALFQAYANEPFNARLHQHVSGSAIVVYIFHWVFLKFFVWFVVRNSHMAENSVLRPFAVPLSFGFSIGCSLLVYAILLRFPRLGALFGV